jgi:hypothetical protein
MITLRTGCGIVKHLRVRNIFSYRLGTLMSTNRTVAAVFAFMIAIAAMPCAHAAPSNRLPSGALRSAPSLYLRQSASSSIDWQPYGPTAFALAARLHRPILLDDGAVWCHWCHMMDEHTYVDRDLAALINREYVPIKLDADERPDVDAYYQDAAAHLTGATGWPLTCITTDSGALLYAAGYLPARAKADSGDASAMIPLLTRIADIYGKEKDSLAHQAEALSARIRYEGVEAAPQPLEWNQLRERVVASLAREYDRENGGFGSGEGPRFFDFPAIRLALAEGFYGNHAMESIALDSLRKIGDSGTLDQIGGGFHRYATDAKWRIPHFEKMAYDQALAIEVYADAFEYKPSPELERVLRGLVDYVNSTLLDRSNHYFYSHQDSDAFAGDDGGYYTWTPAEIHKILAPDEARAAIAMFAVESDSARAPDGRIVLRRAMETDALAKALNVSPEKARELAERAVASLKAARRARPAPIVDRAAMTDRNALIVQAYFRASHALGDPSLRRIALDAVDFFIARMRAPGGAFYHVWSDATPHVAGLAADQAYMLGALVDAYQESGDEKYLTAAKSISKLLSTRMRSSGSNLIANEEPADAGPVAEAAHADRRVLYDSSLPSPQAAAATAMMKLGAITADVGYNVAADSLLEHASAMATSMLGTSVASLTQALELKKRGVALVAVVGAANDARTIALMDSAFKTYRPGKVVIRVDSFRAATAPVPASALAQMTAAASSIVPVALVCDKTACASAISDASALAQAITEFGADRAAVSGIAAR